jgi:Fibronectin type III domain
MKWIRKTNPEYGAKIFSLRWLINAQMLSALPSLANMSVPLSWNPSVDSNVAGYKIYYGVASQVYTNSVDVGNVTNAIITGLSENTTYFFAAKTYDASSVESDFSNETVYSTMPAILTPTSCATGYFALSVSGDTNFQYVVQASTNLLDWVSMQTNSAPFTFVDSNACQFSQCFYRTINLP